MNQPDTGKPASHQYAPASRRSHRKVRTGCGICKRRKIKCDEQKPSCRNCIKHSVESTPLSGDTALRTLWRINVPQLGLSFHFVMRGILALSAMHLSHLCPSKQDFYLAIAVSEHEAALRTATALLPHANAENCSALYIFSTITFFFALASPKQPGDMLLTPSTGKADWLTLLRGVRHLSKYFREQLLDGPFGAMFVMGSARIEQGESLSRSSHVWLTTPQHMQLVELRRFLVDSISNPRKLRIYEDSIGHMEACFCSCWLSSSADHPGPGPYSVSSLGVTASRESLSMPPISSIYSWLYRAPEEYIELLFQKEPEALVIFAYYCVLLKSLDGCWWMQGWPAHLMQEIWDALGHQYRLWIRWPMEEIGWRPTD